MLIDRYILPKQMSSTDVLDAYCRLEKLDPLYIRAEKHARRRNKEEAIRNTIKDIVMDAE